MPKPPLVSVVIPCYRQAHFLAEAIESVRAQDYPLHETIVIDDGSPDDVALVVAGYPEVHGIQQENRGLSGARNRGLAECHGRYVVFLDADDRLLPNALSVGVAALEERPQCAFVWGFRRLIDVKGQALPEDADMSYQGSARYDLLLHENIIGPPVVVMFRRAVVEAVGGYSGAQRHSEDYELLLRIVRSNDSWCHRQVVAEYRVHAESMSHNSAGMLVGNLQALDAQEHWIGSDLALRRALGKGRRNAWETYDGIPRLEELARRVHARRWLPATAAAAVLLRRYPRLFLRALALRARRALLPTGAGRDPSAAD